jgi:hypothetical protein
LFLAILSPEAISRGQEIASMASINNKKWLVSWSQRHLAMTNWSFEAA